MRTSAKVLAKVIALALFLVCVEACPAAEFQKMTLQLAHINPRTPDDQYEKYASVFADKVAEMTGGAVTIDIYGSGQLGGERDVLESMRMGAIDLAIVSNVNLAAVHEPSFIIELPFLFPDRQTAYTFLDGPVNAKLNEIVYENMDIKVIGWSEGGFRNVINNIRPIVEPADFKGLKIRVPESPMFVDTFQALGANPTPVSFTETYTAIQQGTVDGLELPIPSIYSARYYEVTKYMSLTGHFFNAIAMSVSKSFYEMMSPELWEVFVTAERIAAREQRAFLLENDKKQLAAMTEAGLKINDNVNTAAMQATVQPLYEKYRTVIGAELFDEAMAAIRK